MKDFFEKAVMQNHPLRVLQIFLECEKANEQAKKYDEMRFVGYVLDIGYDMGGAQDWRSWHVLSPS